MSPDNQIELPYGESTTLDRLHHNLQFVASVVSEIAASLPQQRRPLPDRTKAIHLRVTWERRNGYCPCCQRVPVCDSGGKFPGAEFDHWFSRHRNASSETWLVCLECNRELEGAEFKMRAQSSFAAYQRALEAMIGHERQRDLF